MHHHWLSALSVLSSVLFASLALPPASLWDDIRVMHTWNTVPENWESLGPPPSGTTIDLHIALKPHHEDALVDALYEVSDPTHRKYGAHLSKEQVAELVAPHPETLEIVHSWLEHRGVLSSSISTSHGGGWLTITDIPVTRADELLSASYQLYRQTGMNETNAILRTVGYALPAALHAHVQTVAPTTHFASPRTPLQTQGTRSRGAVMVNATSGELAGVLSKRIEDVTPPFLRWLYKTQAYVPSAMGQNAIGTLGLLNDYPNQADLTQFMINFREDAEAATFTVVQVNGGGFDPSSPSVDATASIQMEYTGAIAYPTPHVFYSTGGLLQWRTNYGPVSGDAYIEWLNYLLAQPNTAIPRTISTSYCSPETEIPQRYTVAVCDLFAQLGARGVSVLSPSGNDGVGGLRDCYTRGGKTRFIPMFPASCPWVTGVGGTTGQEPEVAAAFSGGTFSRHFRRPAYQDEAVPTYLQYLGTRRYRGFYPRRGRGIPDVASQAQQFVQIHDHAASGVSGTLCSTSTVAGIVSLLNDYQISRGKAPLGFLNPWFYDLRMRTGFNDIQSGSNPGCQTHGFSAFAGWDPVTGLGTLDFEKLQNILLLRT